MTEALIKGLGLGLLLSVSAGPVVFAILKISMKMGHKAGYAFVAGVSVSDIVLVLLGNVAAELVRMALVYETWIAAGGAIMLVAMGTYSLFFGKDPRDDDPNDIRLAFRKRDMARFTLQGFFMNTVNPGPIFFWLTTCTAFAFLPLYDRMVLFSACLATILAIDIIKVYFANRIRRLLIPATLHKIHQFSAIVLIGFGLFIVLGLFYSRFKS